MEHKVLRFIREQQLISGGQKLVVAVSGGPDSVCLLHILAKIQKELDIKLHLAHLNHQLRGAESEADSRYVAGLAQRWDIPATIKSRDVKAYRSRYHASLEESAREVRYTFLIEVAKAAGAERVAVGHTLDDHIETILMHLIRGSGTQGLQGLKPLSRLRSGKNSLTIIRPLLEVSREETTSYCRRHRLFPRMDISNLSPQPLRNRIRLQLLPLLKNYNPQVVATLLRTARIVADELNFIDKEVARLWDSIVQRLGNTIILNKKNLSDLPLALKRRLLRAAIYELTGDLKDIEARHIEALIYALEKPAGKKIILPYGLTFTIDYERYLLGIDSASLSSFPVLESDFKLKVPGTTHVPGWDIEATIADIADSEIEEEANNGLTARLDFNQVGNELTIRPRRPGDRFQPLGMAQPKKLNKFMIDAKIPRSWRGRIPIVQSPYQIIWVVGWRIDERVKVIDNTKKVLRLKFKRR